LSFVRAKMELSAWQRQIFFPNQPVSDIGELTIAGDHLDSCVNSCAELLLNGRLPKITLWSKTASTGASSYQTVTPNVTDECRALIKQHGIGTWHKKNVAQACFHYQTTESVPDGYVLFVGPSRYFDIEPRRAPPGSDRFDPVLARYQAFRKRGTRFDEIAYSAFIRAALPAFPPIVSSRLEFAQGPAFNFGDNQGTFKLLNRMFDFNLSGRVNL